MPRSLTLAVLLTVTPLLGGCLGAPEPYRPGWQPRPAGQTYEEAMEEEMRTMVSADVERETWRMHEGRQEVGRVVGGVSRNPWRSYERDMVKTLGKEGAAPYLAGRVAEPEASPSPTSDSGAGQAPPSEDDGGDDWGGGEGGGGDDWGGGGGDSGW